MKISGKEKQMKKEATKNLEVKEKLKTKLSKFMVLLKSRKDVIMKVNLTNNKSKDTELFIIPKQR